MNTVNLSVTLEKRSDSLDALVVSLLSMSRVERSKWVADSRRIWLSFRQTHGFKSSADLLTHPDNQLKLGKSKVYTVGLTLQHADVSGVETCGWRTDSCTATCVLDNGNGRYNSVQTARNVRTWFLRDHPDAFVVLLVDEIMKARKHGKVLVRLNVNSDLRWYRIIPSLFDGRLRNVSFYDYTKNPAILGTDGMVGVKYRLCYSVSERDKNWNRVHDFVHNGGTVAVVTVRKKSDAPPKVFLGLRVVDGDASDNRFRERGVIVDLSAKGKARLLPVGGFVRNINA